MNPLAPPCQSLSEYALEAAQDKASAKREGGAFAPPRLGFCTPQKPISHYFLLYSTFLLPISFALSVCKNCSIAVHVTSKLSRNAVCHALGTIHRLAFGIYCSASTIVTKGAWSSSSPAINSTGHSIVRRKSSPTSILLQNFI